MHEPPSPSAGSIEPLRAAPLNKMPPVPTEITAPPLGGTGVGAAAVGAFGPVVLVGFGALVGLATAGTLVGVAGASAGATVGASVGGAVPVGVSAIAVCVPAESVAFASVRAKAISVARLTASAVKSAITSA